jgi:hypothetical protein
MISVALAGRRNGKLQQRVALPKDIGFDEVEETDRPELLESHQKEQSHEDLMLLQV